MEHLGFFNVILNFWMIYKAHSPKPPAPPLNVEFWKFRHVSAQDWNGERVLHLILSRIVWIMYGVCWKVLSIQETDNFDFIYLTFSFNYVGV